MSFPARVFPSHPANFVPASERPAMIATLKRWLPPVAALLLSVCWIASQQRDLDELERQNAGLRSEIQAARNAGHAAQLNEDPSLAVRLATSFMQPGRKFDWRRFLSRYGADGESDRDMRVVIHLRRILLELSAEELFAGLDELEAMNLTSEARRDLENTLIDILARKDPQGLLNRMETRISDEQNPAAWVLAVAFQKWSRDDPLAAARWMDERIKAGTFETKSLEGFHPNRLRFEASLVDALLASDPTAAASRIALIPEDQRGNVFRQSIFLNVRPGREAAIADLIRGTVPETHRAPTLADVAGNLTFHGGLERAEGFLNAISPSEQERSAVVGKAVEKRLSANAKDANIGEIRSWIVQHAPHDAERLSGEALAKMVGSRGFGELAGLAKQYGQSSGNDDALVAFLKNAPDESRFEILEMAESIRDPAKRHEVTRRFINNPNRAAEADDWHD